MAVIIMVGEADLLTGRNQARCCAGGGGGGGEV